jgi:hypothetical protein
MSKNDLQKNGWPQISRKKRLCYDMKGISKIKVKERGHKHLFRRPGVPGHSFFCHCILEAF